MFYATDADPRVIVFTDATVASTAYHDALITACTLVVGVYVQDPPTAAAVTHLASTATACYVAALCLQLNDVYATL